MASNSSDFGHNKYATKKTITQGLLDIALLTANVSQLKFLLEVGESHPYYVLLLTLLAVSLALQLLRSCVNVVLGALYDIAEETQQKTAAVLNNVVLGLGVVTTVVNAIISAFDMSETVVPQ
ncbi:ninjurin-1 [Cryptotermes secundus]|uniref:ninjurin-1 n=1 Tax=Cryptotermes secundus TaxID=105785 RepID=UPI000CD7DDDB|nr:ninjurin-1 [Cryptotermes secundus]